MAASVLEVLITGDATSLKLAFTQATAATQEYAAATKTSSAATQEASTTSKLFGSVSTLAFNAAKLGVLAFAAVSVKAAFDFNRQFTQIAAITNTAASEIGGLKDTVMGLSQQTAVAPTELAHSLYFLASAGLSTQQQMEALDASAKGTAIGLGESGDLARITANALNAFSDQGLQASQVMDTLVAAVREGTAEPDEFATALGRVLPIADQAGISFQSVAASLATMSNAGLDVNEGVTALRATLQSLTAPTAQTEKAFGSMGLSVDEVVRSMGSQGLMATLRLVSDAAKKATSTQGEYNQMMRHAIPNIRGLAGSLNLLHQDTSKVDEIFKQVKNSTGDMETAFATTEQSGAFRISQALREVSNAGMELATAVLPVIATALETIAGPIAAILPYVVQLGAAFLAWKVVTSVLPAIAAAIPKVLTNVMLLADGVKTLTFEINPWLLVAGIAVVTLGALTGNFKIAGIAAGVLAVQIGLMSGAISEAQAQMGAFGLALLGVSEAWKSIQGLEGDTKSAASGFAKTMEGQNEALITTTERVNSALGERQTGIMSFFGLFTDHANYRGYRAFDEAVAQVKQDITDQNNAITHGTPLMQTYAGWLNNTSTTSLKLHGAFAQVLTDYYRQNDGLRGLNTVQLNAMITSGRWTAAINLVSDALERSNEQINRQAQAQGNLHQSIIASDFARLAPFIDSLGMSFDQFQQAATEAFNGSKEDADKFLSDMTSKWTEAWTNFKAQAVTALDFTSKALADLGSAAASAQEQLAGDTSDMSKDALAALGDQANITSSEIISSFKAAAAQTRSFGHDLLDIAKVGGDAGKALASSLLQSGNAAAAATIANSPMEKQIVALYGKNQAMVDNLSTKLTNSIVGPLDKIVNLLQALAKHWGLTINPKTGKAHKDLDTLGMKVHKLTDTKHVVETVVKDGVTQPIAKMGGDVDDLVRNTKVVRLIVGDTWKAQLQTFEGNLDKLTSRKYTVDVGVHTHGDSPMPDEALKQHLFDPMKEAGFKRVGDTYTLPLEVGAHTDVNDPTGGKGGAGLRVLRELEKRQLNVLLDIRKELKKADFGHRGHDGGGGGSSTGGGTGGGGGGATAGAHLAANVDKIVGTVNKFASLKDARNVVERVAGKGRDTEFIRQSIQQVSHELGKTAAQRYGQALRQLDDATRASEKRRNAALQESLDAIEAIRQNHQAKMDARDVKKLYPGKNVPKLPRGHTMIDPNEHQPNRHPHQRGLVVLMDRKRYADSLTQEVSYGRGY